jgi:MarR family transcriptional regulator, organic hydroperoxide resistance regulator
MTSTPDRFPPALDDGLNFMRLLWALDHALQRASKRMAATLGLTGPQRLVVRIVGRFPGIPAGHLAALLHVHPSTLTGVLSRLERQLLIRRRPDPRDGRRVLLGLTARGRSFDVETEGTIEEAIREALVSVDPSKLVAAREVLDAVAAKVGRLSAKRERTSSALERGGGSDGNGATSKTAQVLVEYGRQNEQEGE